MAEHYMSRGDVSTASFELPSHEKSGHVWHISRNRLPT